MYFSSTIIANTNHFVKHFLSIIYVFIKPYPNPAFLGEKQVRASAPVFPNSPAKQTQDAWACLRQAHASIGLSEESLILVHLFYQIRTYFQNHNK